MNRKLRKAAVIGGDKRQEYAATLLEEQGYEVSACGIAASHVCRDIKEAVENAELILGPVPFSKDGLHIQAKDTTADLLLEALVSCLNAGQVLAGGCIPEAVKEACRNSRTVCFDYMESEALAVYNSIATAEGAIAEAIIRHPSNLHGARALVLGYGRCAKTLAQKLDGLSVEVTVYARSLEARMQAFAQGCPVMEWEEAYRCLPSFDYLFNTVPAMVLDEKALRALKPSAVIIDIATAPGGVDLKAAETIGIDAALYPGLPGKYSPYSSAKAIVEEVLRHCINN